MSLSQGAFKMKLRNYSLWELSVENAENYMDLYISRWETGRHPTQYIRVTSEMFQKYTKQNKTKTPQNLK